MSYPIFTVLPVGQGNCSLIEVYNDDPNVSASGATLEFLAMVDCGVIARTKGGTDTKNINQSKNYTLNKWKKGWEEKRKTSRTTSKMPYSLDIFIRPNQDNKHWSILNQRITKDMLKMNNKKWYRNEKPSHRSDVPTTGGYKLKETTYSAIVISSQHQRPITEGLPDTITNTQRERKQQDNDFNFLERS